MKKNHIITRHVCLKKKKKIESINFEITLLHQNKAFAENFILHFYLNLKCMNLYCIE